MEIDPEMMGEILIEEGLVFQEDLEQALQDGPLRTSPVGTALRGMTLVRRAELAAMIGTDYQFVRFSGIAQYKPSADVLDSISAELAVKHTALPLAKSAGVLFVVMGNPSLEASREIRRKTGLRLKLLQAPAEEVKKAVQDLYLKPPVSVESEIMASPRPVQPAPVMERVAATRISADEFRQSEQFQNFMRVIADWEGNYITGRPVPAIRIT